LSLSIAATPPFSWCSAIRGRCAVRASDRAHRLQHDPRRLHLAPARLSPRHRLRIRAPALGLENPHRYRRCATRLQGRVMRDTFFVDDTVTMAMIRKPGSQQACAPRLRLCKRGGPVRRARDPFSATCSAFLERGPSPRPTEARLRVSRATISHRRPGLRSMSSIQAQVLAIACQKRPPRGGLSCT
jgi:hypothetical protein